MIEPGGQTAALFTASTLRHTKSNRMAIKITILMAGLVAAAAASQAKDPKINLSVRKEIQIHAAPAKAWQALGPGFTDAYKWASSVNHSEGRGPANLGASCTERACSTVMGPLKEKITDYSDADMMLSYLAYEGMPKMVKHARNTWRILPQADGTCKLDMHMEFQLGGMGKLMKPMMKMKLSGMAQDLVEDFKHWVEKGQPSPKKAKAMRKQAR